MELRHINGIIVVNKEQDFTSHDVVAVMRRILGTKKVGHTGTLDPQATGVLPICVGKGTKVSDMLTNSDKEYLAEVTLGVTTDTDDIWGTVLKTEDVSAITDEMIISAAKNFIGEIKQMPPMYSAIKINGKKLYEYARKGIEVERKERDVVIKDITVESIKGNKFTMRVACSKGTYIRSLCKDIGGFLGVGACMSSLVRTKSSVFSLESAKTIDEIKEFAEKSNIADLIIPIDTLFADFKEIILNQDDTAKMLNGMFLPTPFCDGKYRVYSHDKKFICIGEAENNILKIVKNFYAQ